MELRYSVVIQDKHSYPYCYQFYSLERAMEFAKNLIENEKSFVFDRGGSAPIASFQK